MSDETALNYTTGPGTWADPMLGDWAQPFGQNFANLANYPMSQMYVDTQTGQLVTAAQAQQLDPQQFELSMGRQYDMTNPGSSLPPNSINRIVNTPSGQLQDAEGNTNGGVLNALLLNRLLGGQTGQQSSGNGGWSLRDENGNVNWGTALGLGTAGLAGIGGLAGIIQQLSRGNTSSTIQRNVAPPTGAEQQAQQVGLQGLQGAQQFAFGSGATNNTPPGTGQPGISPWSQTADGQYRRFNEATGQYEYYQPQQQQQQSGGLAGQLGAQAPLQDAALREALMRVTQQGNPFVGNSPLLQALGQQTPNYLQQQASLLGNAAVQGAQVSPMLGMQAQGMLQGNLPALNPALQQQIGNIFNARQQDVNRYLDTALQGSMERARQQGFAGGLDMFNEGTPQAIMAPALAEAVRQRGTLAGQQAEAELGLAQSLPQQGANLAGQNAQLLGGLAQQYTTPMSVALGGGLNLSNLNQNIVNSLGQFGQQGIQNQLGFLQALSAPVNSANTLAANQAYTRALGSGQTTTQPFNLLNAFAPTAQLLGGIGGVLSGVGGTQRPSTMSGILG